MERHEIVAVVDSLYESWYGALVRYAARLVGRMDLAEEVVQESFLNLYRELRAGTPIGNAKAWVFCVVRREVNRQIHHHLKREVGLEDADILEAAVAHAPAFEGDDFARLLKLLTRREEEVLLLRLESLKYREIAERLDISPYTVNALLARALRKLKDTLTPRGAEPASPARGARHVPKTLQ